MVVKAKKQYFGVKCSLANISEPIPNLLGHPVVMVIFKAQ